MIIVYILQNNSLIFAMTQCQTQKTINTSYVMVVYLFSGIEPCCVRYVVSLEYKKYFVVCHVHANHFQDHKND